MCAELCGDSPAFCDEFYGQIERHVLTFLDHKYLTEKIFKMLETWVYDNEFEAHLMSSS